MSKFRVVALSTRTADYVRAKQKAPVFGHPAFTSVATGHGPCRHCLTPFRIGEESRTLFTFDAFDGTAAVPLPGPVFIHSDGCARYAEDAGYPPALVPYPVLLVAYAGEQQVVAQQRVAAGMQEEAVNELLSRSDVDYIHVRDGEAGCFDFRVEKMQENA
ncbi:MAG TPA: DUF1203 domain-containing protein [Terriglobales bacterium]|nr:DUF1203 domain-containing protein [Terriglobales bacterium]